MLGITISSQDVNDFFKASFFYSRPVRSLSKVFMLAG
ncbi:hypothetical protein NEOC95_002376 [Neochlamydia sp. AcF95]|nr:hypothetical protein [Neochlamydia sp. AcF95]